MGDARRALSRVTVAEAVRFTSARGMASAEGAHPVGTRTGRITVPVGMLPFLRQAFKGECVRWRGGAVAKT